MFSIPLITAHSGCEGTARDSIDAVHAGIRMNADAVEVDVRLDEKDRLVLSHDRKSQAEYDRGTTLEAAMRFVSEHERLAINCDLKEHALAGRVIELANRFGIGSDRLILSGTVTPEYLSVHPETACKASVYLNAEHILGSVCLSSLASGEREEAEKQMTLEVWPTIKRYMQSIDPYMTLLSAAVRNTGAKALNIPYLLINEARMDRFKSEGILVSVWTVNETPDIENMVLWGVHNITTLSVANTKKALSALASRENT